MSTCYIYDIGYRLITLHGCYVFADMLYQTAYLHACCVFVCVYVCVSA